MSCARLPSAAKAKLDIQAGPFHLPRVVLGRLAKIVTVAALVVTIGAHWALLQTVAWTAMLAGNLSRRPVCQVVSFTFDGKHACCLCKAIAAGKKSEKKKDPAFQFKKLECPPAPLTAASAAPLPFAAAPWTGAFPDTPARQPPTPPPRALLA